MKYSILFTFSFLLLFSQNTFSQTQKTKELQNLQSEQLASPTSILKDIRSIPKKTKTILESPLKNFKTSQIFPKRTDTQRFIKIKKDESTGLPIWIYGKLENAPQQRNASIESRAINYLEAVKEPLQIKNPAEEFFIQKINTDKLGQQHIRMQQQFQGIKIYNSEIIVHSKDQDIYLVNGRHYPTPQLENITPTINLDNAKLVARNDVGTFKTLSLEEKKYVAGEQFESELVIFFPEKKLPTDQANPKLAYHLTVIPNMTERWEYLIDAENGNVLNKYSSICKFHVSSTGLKPADDLSSHKNCNHKNNFAKSSAVSKPVNDTELVNGPFTTNATDLLGISRTINTYEVNGTYYMYDGSRQMFNINSDLPSDPKGMIVTVDGLGNYPSNNNFDYSVITSNNNSWNYPAAISAHYNGGEAYEYFKFTHNRESINGEGGTIISFFNIGDENGNEMDNAFWNGAAMFYGNGDQAFNFPLQRALDVAGHEMSHGVIQGTANLEYQGQSGAMNESFADIFGAMIDRDDWQMGEDITNPSYISTGALRSLSDPNNGGSSLSNAGWQPKTMSEYQNLPNTPQGDNGGVHINSGITNYAYYLFATDIGKDKAELIYYRALDVYLVKSSQFVDLRNAVVQATNDLYGSTEVNAANAAFDAVGIGQGTGGTYQNDVNLNDGEERILHSDADLDKLYLADLAGINLADPQLSLTNITSKPSITDDGTVIVFIDDENNIKYIDIDWATGITDEGYLENNPTGEWRNIAISKDGNRIAAVRTTAENIIWVYDFNLGAWNDFELYNPTTSDPNGGIVTTGEVEYADAMEFDFSGEYLMYDAFNKIANSAGNNEVEYWDIGFLNVFENGNFANGNIEKLFAGLPSGVSIGNPTFAKNSPYIVAFDFREEGFFSTNYQILGANIQTGDNEVIREGETWAYPNYSVNDEQMIFDLPYQGTTVLGKININANKISGDAASENFLFPDGTIAEKWGVWFATGERDLVATNEIRLADLNGKIYPNPFDENLILELEATQNEKTTIQIFNLLGQSVFEKNVEIAFGKNTFDLNLKNLNAGNYFIQLQLEEGNVMMKIVKK